MGFPALQPRSWPSKTHNTVGIAVRHPRAGSSGEEGRHSEALPRTFLLKTGNDKRNRPTRDITSKRNAITRNYAETARTGLPRLGACAWPTTSRLLSYSLTYMLRCPLGRHPLLSGAAPDILATKGGGKGCVAMLGRVRAFSNRQGRRLNSTSRSVLHDFPAKDYEAAGSMVSRDGGPASGESVTPQTT
ncbi:hypothetical protein VUR80DRAFT_683 [Thermomyces stellatus]